MIELEKGKTSLQLPEKLQEELPVELHPFVFEKHHPEDDEIVLSDWIIEHFISSNPEYGGNIILFYNKRNQPSYEINIEASKDFEIREFTKIRKGLDNNSIRTTIDVLKVDYATNSIQSILSSVQNPSDQQP